jgi:hypothetical protein
VDSKKADLIKMTSWIVQLDSKAKSKLVSRFLKEKHEVLTIHEIYLTDVALAVHFILNISKTDISCYANVKEAVAGILQLLSGYAEQQGIVVPIIGVILPRNQENGDIENEVGKWAADQDWHRGDFSLFYSSAQKATEMVYSLLSSATIFWKEIDKISPLTSEVYLQKLKSEFKTIESTAEHQGLMNTIIRAWETGEPIGDAIMKWTTDSLSEINLLTEEEGE